MELGDGNVNSVKMSKEQRKLIRKQIKACNIVLKHDGISTASHATKHLVVANGGLGNGVSREQLREAMKEMGELETVIMSPHKPYAFVTYRSEQSAQKAHGLLNGHVLRCGDNSVTLYLSFVDSVPCEAEERVSLPEGLALVEDFVSLEEEAALLAAVDWSSTSDDVTAQKALKHRRVKHYGYEFRYDTNNVDKDKPLSVGLPDECVPMLKHCLKDGHIGTMPDQLTVNQYQPGQGIPPHVDTHSAFEDTILSLSLGSKTVMEFRHPDGRVVAVLLPGRSLLVMKGESRYLWSHGITPRKFDMVPACDPQPPAAITPDLGHLGNLTLSKRATRTSFTFRRIRRSPCQCAFPSTCDSQGALSAPAPSPPPSPPSLPRSHGDAARLEEEYVHRVYDAIAPHFSSTRHSPWPRVCHFLSSLEPGDVLADVGCGNGKYLGVNPELVVLGCDRSSALVHICTERGFQAFVSDALSVPMRTASCDACISIAVIHHFSTQERRLAAVRELVRLLKPGGRALIYVWALEQEYNKQRSKYLKDPSKEPSGSPGPTENQSEGSTLPQKTVNSHGDSGVTDDGKHYREVSGLAGQRPDEDQVHSGKLSVHTNRTAFNSQDLLVPWHLKDGKGKAEKGRKGEREAGNFDKMGKRKAGSAVSKDNPLIDEQILPSSGPTSDCKTESTDSKQLGSTRPDFMLAQVTTSKASLDSSLPSSTKDTDDASNSCPGFEVAPSPAPPESVAAAAVFHRYYHVFQQGEIEKVCCQVAGVKVQTSYHDQGNWCVILVKD
ncbi:Alkylated DNA repair protein alkB 8 [Merluccius polli]|uniref:tRNA (carboxymethyluridine(34)-5-O)-methyltransferase n=1 Tax=Merluccius polli TaxID=89951 RepID=A0AA47NXP4_MERPO|nr:Alkylated DNA repair protein alkB 8 [Merluccius polli]